MLCPFCNSGDSQCGAQLAVRLKHAGNHGKKLTSPVPLPLDLHTCGEIHKHYILKNYATNESMCSIGFNVIATCCLNIIMCIHVQHHQFILTNWTNVGICSCVTFVLRGLWMSIFFLWFDVCISLTVGCAWYCESSKFKQGLGDCGQQLMSS